MSIETLPKNTHESTAEHPSLNETFKKLTESLRPRIDQAVESCDFESSPEIEGAIKSYYEDHYKTALVLERILDGETINPQILMDDAGILESFVLTEGLHKITTETNRRKQLQAVSDLIGKQLFAEVAVGQTTLNEQELLLVTGLNTQLQETAEREGIYLKWINTKEELLETSKYRVQQFWEDSRNAGQLEFHNTPFIDELAKANFKLQTRSAQKRTNDGNYNAVTADSDWHSNTLHFSESYLSDGYKIIQAGKQVEQVTIGATVALPIAEIVKQVPYARGGEYGVIGLKAGVENKATVIDDANIYAFGGYENPGYVDDTPSKIGSDRTWYADKHNRQKGEDYAIDFGRAMSSPTGNLSQIIVLQRDIDAAHRKQYMQNAENVDSRLDFGSGEGYPPVVVLDYDYGKLSSVAPQREMELGKLFIDEQYHHHSANALGITDPRLSRKANKDYSYRDGISPEEQEAELRQQIHDMQKHSRERSEYQGKIVAMLRGGTMAYTPDA